MKKIIHSDKCFHVINTIFLAICFLLVALPILNVIASSLSSPNAVIRGQVSFWPKGLNIDAYKQIFQTRMLLTGYKNSIIYTVIGTAINIFMTILAAYPLSVKDFVGRKLFTSLFLFVMIFSAPLIPTYLNIKNLKLLDSMWALVLPGAISVYNMIIARTYFQNSIPAEMLGIGKTGWMQRYPYSSEYDSAAFKVNYRRSGSVLRGCALEFLFRRVHLSVQREQVYAAGCIKKYHEFCQGAGGNGGNGRAEHACGFD